MTGGLTPVLAEARPIIGRRGVLQGVACAAAIPLLTPDLSLPSPGPADHDLAPIRYHRILYDRDDPAAASFGRAGLAAGLPVEAIGPDLTALWRDLSVRWRQAPVAVGGLTNETTALYLQHLAQDAGLRLVLRASHTPLDDGRVRHHLTGPRSMLQHAELLNAAEDWPLGAVALLRHCPPQLDSKATLTCTSRSGGLSASAGSRLVSWAMAPVRRKLDGLYT